MRLQLFLALSCIGCVHPAVQASAPKPQLASSPEPIKPDLQPVCREFQNQVIIDCSKDDDHAAFCGFYFDSNYPRVSSIDEKSEEEIILSEFICFFDLQQFLATQDALFPPRSIFSKVRLVALPSIRWGI